MPGKTNSWTNTSMLGQIIDAKDTSSSSHLSDCWYLIAPVDRIKQVRYNSEAGNSLLPSKSNKPFIF